MFAYDVTGSPHAPLIPVQAALLWDWLSHWSAASASRDYAKPERFRSTYFSANLERRASLVLAEWTSTARADFSRYYCYQSFDARGLPGREIPANDLGTFRAADLAPGWESAQLWAHGLASRSRYSSSRLTAMT